MSWFLYLIECDDGSVYTGITTDVDARFAQHANGTGARYTRSRKPRTILATFALADRSSASRAEYWVKRLTPRQKRELASGLRSLDSVLPAVTEIDDGADVEAAAGAVADAAAGDASAAMTGIVAAVVLDGASEVVPAPCPPVAALAVPPTAPASTDPAPTTSRRARAARPRPARA